MRWTDRQLAMLREMGVHVVVRPAVPAPSDEASDEVAPSEAPRSVPVPVEATRLAAVLRRAGWLVVVEIDDDETGDGDERRLLGNMLRAIGVSEDGESGEGGDPARRAVRLDPRQAGAAAVADAIERTGARAVLALGKSAAKVLLGSDEPVGRLRGTVHRAANGVEVIVSWPPSYLLRQPDEKAKAWADLCLAVSTIEAASSTST